MLHTKENVCINVIYTLTQIPNTVRLNYIELYKIIKRNTVKIHLLVSYLAWPTLASDWFTILMPVNQANQ